jgi:fused signal recognition particle receptor
LNPFAKLKDGLSKTRHRLVDRVADLFVGREDFTPEVFESLEELLIEADLGVDLAVRIAGEAERQIGRRKISGDDLEGVLGLLRESLAGELAQLQAQAPPLGTPHVILMVGVNGVGKTTSAAKLAWRYQQEGKKVLLAAADTFRAAAIDQLGIWAERLGCEFVRHQDGADPSAVIFDSLKAAEARGVDVLIADTAGRLHNKQHLMAELGKMRRVAEREVPGAPHEVLLVIDANTGQNAIQQSRVFKEITDVTGIVLAKLDGTAKGGVIFAIGRELGLPVRYVGVGEKLEDLAPFEPGPFTEALLARD